MTNLIYLVSLNWEESEDNVIYNQMTSFCIETLREAGNYTDDIILFTYDTDYDWNEDVIIKTPDEQCNSFGEVMLYKMKARNYFNPSDYDTIMYLDTDIIAINDVNPLFNLSDNNIVFAEEFPINFITNIDFPYLTEKELKDAEDMPRINAGTFIINSDIYDKYMEKMEAWVKDHNESGLDPADQLPITTMILRGELNYDNIPHGWIEFPLATKTVGPPPVINEDTKLLHFLGHKYDIDSRIAHMEKAYDHKNDYDLLNDYYSP